MSSVVEDECSLDSGTGSDVDALSLHNKSLSASLGLSTIFEDPISFDVMEDAMMTPCGHSFSESSITEWLRKHQHCPICNKGLKIGQILPNYALRTAISKFITAQKMIEAQQSRMRKKEDSASSLDDNSKLSFTVSEIQSDIATPPTSPQLNMSDWAVINVDTHNPEEEELHTSNSRLLVEIVSAKNLVKTDWFGHSDPYCVVEFQGQTKRSRVLQHTRDPKWEETFVFGITGETADNQYDMLCITVWNRERLLKDRFMGSVRLQLREIMDALKMVRRFSLERLHPTSRKRVQGDLLLRLQVIDLKKSYENSKIERRMSLASNVSTSSLSTSPSTPSTPIPMRPQLGGSRPPSPLVSSPEHYNRILRANSSPLARQNSESSDEDHRPADRSSEIDDSSESSDNAVPAPPPMPQYARRNIIANSRQVPQPPSLPPRPLSFILPNFPVEPEDPPPPQPPPADDEAAPAHPADDDPLMNWIQQEMAQQQSDYELQLRHQQEEQMGGQAALEDVALDTDLDAENNVDGDIADLSQQVQDWDHSEFLLNGHAAHESISGSGSVSGIGNSERDGEADESEEEEQRSPAQARAQASGSSTTTSSSAFTPIPSSSPSSSRSPLGLPAHQAPLPPRLVPAPSPPASPTVRSLMELGFTQQQAEMASRTTNNIDEALDSLLS
eukprot:TRINITY_DN3521_c0_g1_i1.p1 TRINITY_DN3521_c0_g1~~TRINITY_DN3521_c0_g1_i1.p1  ORF type:complete len:672 (-),score=209.61 TRINITY_DN3521_c0_g1_i1:68-2083(-)